MEQMMDLSVLMMFLGMYFMFGVFTVLLITFVVFYITGFHYFEWFLKKAESGMDE